MSSELEFTGERFTPECEREIWYEHMHRYAFAAQLCGGMRVLDAACGEGYGSALLATVAADVTGLDISAEAIRHAGQRYAGNDTLKFEVGDCTRLAAADDQYDCVVSFETLEHLEDQAGMLAEFRRVLKPDGFLLLSSPDRTVYSDELGNRNEYHVCELDGEELKDLIAETFPAFRLLGQRLLFHSAIWSLSGGDRAVFQQLRENDLEEGASVKRRPVYFIAICAGDEDSLPRPEQDVWLFDDSAGSVYQHYLGEIRRNMAAGGIIADRDREIEKLKHQLESASRPPDHWFMRLFRRS